VAWPVLFSPEAEAQLLSLERYIADAVAPDIAERFINADVDHCASLTDFPLRGSPRDDFRASLRTLSFRRRVAIAYAGRADRVEILGIFYGGQNIAAWVGEDE
jgi:toxin ParE1/3/4